MNTGCICRLTARIRQWFLLAAGLLCLAATHDIELCDLLGQSYTLCHFEEQVGEHGMLFDYVLRGGRATSRNAINLLALIGFDQTIVENAHEKANRYLETGSWEPLSPGGKT